MAVRRKHDISTSMTKLSRLLETEDELEGMLAEARREAEEILDAAKRASENRTRQLVLQIEQERHELRERIATERDLMVAKIRSDAEREATRLQRLDEAAIDELARHVVDLLVGPNDSRGPD